VPDLLTSDVWKANMERPIGSTLLLLLGIPGVLQGQQEMFKLEGAVTSAQGDPIAGAVITTSSPNLFLFARRAYLRCPAAF
jgi:hypothetical protein